MLQCCVFVTLVTTKCSTCVRAFAIISRPEIIVKSEYICKAEYVVINLIIYECKQFLTILTV